MGTHPWTSRTYKPGLMSGPRHAPPSQRGLETRAERTRPCKSSTAFPGPNSKSGTPNDIFLLPQPPHRIHPPNPNDCKPLRTKVQVSPQQQSPLTTSTPSDPPPTTKIANPLNDRS